MKILVKTETLDIYFKTSLLYRKMLPKMSYMKILGRIWNPIEQILPFWKEKEIEKTVRVYRHTHTHTHIYLYYSMSNYINVKTDVLL